MVHEFSNEVISYFVVSEVDQSFVEIAKNIDEDLYQDDCFEFCVNYDVENYSFHVVTDNDNELCYVDYEGNKNFLANSKIPSEIDTEAIFALKKVLRKQEINKRLSDNKTYSSDCDTYDDAVVDELIDELLDEITRLNKELLKK